MRDAASFKISLGLGICNLGCCLSAAQIPAFPSAEGFGALATGGRGGYVCIVSNLDNSGPGSFRESVSKGHRTVLFSVGGVIRLKSNVSVASDITIAGQTAPGEGITLYGHSVSFSGSSNLIARFLRFREGIGGDRGKCSINIAGGANMIFDHISIEWGRWDCLGVTQGSHDITFQNCIVGEALDPQRFGALVDSVTNVTLSHNLWLHNHSRNPKAKGTIQYINNVVYNWGITGLVGGHSGADHQLDIVGNYFIKGPSSNERFLGMFTGTDHVFASGNFADLNRDGLLNGRAVTESDFADSGGKPTFVAASFLQPQVAVKVNPADVAYQMIVEKAGCSLHRDAVDARLIADVASFGKAGRIIHAEAEVGGMSEVNIGPATASIKSDGIPDEWKRAHGFDLKDPNVPSADYNKDAYTNLEKYFNELAGDR
jgi:pectate lyase